MFRKSLILLTLAMFMTAATFADTSRTRLTRENRIPELRSADVGVQYFHADYDNGFEEDLFQLDGRYGLYENLTLRAGIPFGQSDLSGSSETGFGDAYIGLELLAFEDIFRYPFVIPHIDLVLPTGDDDKALGSGETSVEIGVSVGTTIWDQLTWIIDFTYAHNGGFPQDSDDDVYMVSGSLVWDVSDRFAVLAEGRIWEENIFNDNPYQVMGGFTYDFTEALSMGLYGGQFREDVIGAEITADLTQVRFNYAF